MPGRTGNRKNKRRRLSASEHAHHKVGVKTRSSHGRVVASPDELTASPDHGRVIDTCPEPLATPSYARHDQSSSESTAEVIVVTKVMNLSGRIPSGTLSSGMRDLSGERDSDDAGNNEKCNVADIISNFSSDELPCHAADEDLLVAINSESSSEAVSILTRCNTVTQDGLNQALISACRRGHQQLVQTLVWVGANIEYPDENGNTPLLICAENGFTDIVRFLVSRHANVRAVNSVGNTALILSIRSASCTDLIRLLLEQQDIDVHHQNQHGHTALHKATNFRDVDTMRLLLQKSRRHTHTGYLNNKEFEYETDSYVTNRKSAEIKQEVIAARVGLSGVYTILKEHARTYASPLELAIKAGDIISLNKLLDCQFSYSKFSSSSGKQFYIDTALMYMFENSQQLSVHKFSSTEKTIIQRLLQCGANVNQGPRLEILSRAVESGDFQLVELLCAYGAGKRERDPLRIAAMIGRQDLIKLLLKYQADINTRYGYPNSALDIALRYNHIECAKLLIQRGAKMDVMYALFSAVDDQAADSMHFLFENYKPEIMDHFSQSLHSAGKLLVCATRKGNCEIIGHILDADVGVNEVDSDGHTPLMESRSREVAEFLIQRGADINQVTTGRCGIETPLISMIRHNGCAHTSTVELCQLLIGNGASVNCRNKEGKTPLVMAAAYGDCVGMLQMLLGSGAELNDKDNNGDTALHHAITKQYSENVCCLIDSCRDKKSVINVHNNEGLTPLMVCAEKGNIKIMKALIEGGADVNLKDNQENTALHHLLIAPHPGYCEALLERLLKAEDMLECLLKAGSDVNCQNSDGLSPLMLTTRKSASALMMSLLDAGADVNAVSMNNHSQTALSLLSDTNYLRDDTLLCIETLLDRGARSSYCSHKCLHSIMLEDKINVIPELIECGLGPADFEANIVAWRRVTSNRPSTVSPLGAALLYGQMSLARYFVDILFLTSSDLFMFTSNKAMECLLTQEKKEESLNFLQELSSQPMSLVQLSLVAVSSAVGPSPGRETRVDSLSLPQMMKDRLMFKSEDDKHLLLSRAAAEFIAKNNASPVSSLCDHLDCGYTDYDDDDDDDESDDYPYNDFDDLLFV